MKKLPLTKFDKFVKVHSTLQFLPPNCELFWYEKNTIHFQINNYVREGILIKWDDNLFELDYYFDNFVLKK